MHVVSIVILYDDDDDDDDDDRKFTELLFDSRL